MFLQMEDGSWMVRLRTFFPSSFVVSLFECFLMAVFFLISSVFHVTDQNGEKLTDESVISYIEQVICS